MLTFPGVLVTAEGSALCPGHNFNFLIPVSSCFFDENNGIVHPPTICFFRGENTSNTVMHNYIYINLNMFTILPVYLIKSQSILLEIQSKSSI